MSDTQVALNLSENGVVCRNGHLGCVYLYVCMCFRRTYILVLHVFEQSQFSVRSSAVDERLEGSGELLNSHFLTKTHIIC